MMKLCKRTVLAGLLLVIGCACMARAIDRTIAKINDTILTESDLAAVIADVAGLHKSDGIDAFASATSETVAGMFDRALLLQEAKRLHMTPSKEELHRQVEEMVREIRGKFPSEREFYQELAQEGLSLDQLKEQLLKRTRDDFMVYHVVDSQFSVSEADLQKMKAEGGVSRPAALRLRRMGIAVDKKRSAADACREVQGMVAKTITDGISFEEGVRRYSQVPGATEDGGDMGYVAPDSLSADVRRAVDGLQVGQASAPVIAGGYANIFYVESKRGERVALREQKFLQAREDLLNSLRRRAVLQVFDDRLQPLLISEYRSQIANTVASPATSSAMPAAAQPTPAGHARGQSYPAQPAQTPAYPVAPHAHPAYQQPLPTPGPQPGFWQRMGGRRQGQ